jgi:hypothetical protein
LKNKGVFGLLNIQRHNHSPCLFCQYLQMEVKEVTNALTSDIWLVVWTRQHTAVLQPVEDGIYHTITTT